MIESKQISRSYHTWEERLNKGASAGPEDIITRIESYSNRSGETMSVQHPS